MQWTAERLAADAGGTLLRPGSRPIRGAFIDTRRPLPGGLFVPVAGRRDGHAFLGAAVAGGAAGVLVRRGVAPPSGDVTVVEVEDTLAAFHRLAAAARRRVAGPVVCVTGSNGKTTTRAFVQAVLEARGGEVLATRGNLNNHLGVPLTLCGPPDRPASAVVEIGMSAPGENAALARIVAPDVAVVTSVAYEHLDSMGSLDAIAAAEAEPLARVPAGGAVVLPSDEPRLAPHVPEGPRVLRVGPCPGAFVQVVSVEVGERTRTRLRLPGGERLDLALVPLGLHNARNAAYAVAVGLALDVPPARMKEPLERVAPVGDRGRRVEAGRHVLLLDCYNANPGSMEAALVTLAALGRAEGRRTVAVLGDMLELGPEQARLHAEVGRKARALGISAMVAVGPLARRTAQTFAADGGEVLASVEADDTDVEAAATVLAEHLEAGEPCAVLLKASRGVQLERLAAPLARRLAAPTGLRPTRDLR